MTDAMTRPMVTDAMAEEWPKYVPSVRLVLAVEQVDHLLADRDRYLSVVRQAADDLCLEEARDILKEVGRDE